MNRIQDITEKKKRKSEVGRRKMEEGSWKLEEGRQKLEVGSWKTEVGRPNMEIGEESVSGIHTSTYSLKGAAFADSARSGLFAEWPSPSGARGSEGNFKLSNFLFSFPEEGKSASKQGTHNRLLTLITSATLSSLSTRREGEEGESTNNYNNSILSRSKPTGGSGRNEIKTIHLIDFK